jgi:signal transduction histidine kinase
MNKNELTMEDFQGRILGYMEKAKIAVPDIKFECRIDVSEKIKISSLVGINLYRIIQEAVNNAIKYANPETISISVTESKRKIKTKIHDDGSGFDPEEVTLGNGLEIMQKRTNEISGRFEIHSNQGQGTTICVTVII